MTGRSERHEIVHVPAPEGVDLVGALLKVRVVEINKRSLLAQPLTPLAAPEGARLPVPPPKPKSSVRLPLLTS